MSFEISLGLVRGLLTAALFAAFIALWVWAWSSKRQQDFTAAARLPLEEETPVATRSPRR
jgi:cytochrome c oxidase cbb3-type subunit IV